MLPSRRFAALRLLHHSRTDEFSLCREVEAACHAASTCADEYQDHVLRAAFNLYQNPRVGVDVVASLDDELVEGTEVGERAAEQERRAHRFQQMLLDKYEALDDRKFQAIIRCRRCGSDQIQWEEKQTRSADEAATLFCECTRCKHRWVTS